MGCMRLVVRPAASSVQSQVSRNFTDNAALKRWAYKASGFNQFGLYHDDCLYENDGVKEALARLPGHLLDERAFRLQRAMQCSVQKTVCPRISGQAMKKTGRKEDIFNLTWRRWSGRGRRRRNGPSWLNNLVSM